MIFEKDSIMTIISETLKINFLLKGKTILKNKLFYSDSVTFNIFFNPYSVGVRGKARV